MGWERRGGSSYYYRKRRVGGRVVSRYVGNGVLAESDALAAAEEKRDRESAQATRSAARAEAQRVDQALREFEKLARAITRGYLIAQGFHRHKGEWRRKREETK